MCKTHLAVDPAPCSGCAAGAGAGPDGRGAVRQHVILRSRFLARSLSTWCSLVEFLSQDRIFVTDIRRVTNAPRFCFFNTATLRVRPRASLSPAPSRQTAARASTHRLPRPGIPQDGAAAPLMVGRKRRRKPRSRCRAACVPEGSDGAPGPVPLGSPRGRLLGLPGWVRRLRLSPLPYAGNAAGGPGRGKRR